MEKIKSLISYSRVKVLIGLVAAFSFLIIGGSALAASQVMTLPATATATTLTLNGTYSGNTAGDPMQVRFEWGSTPNLGTFTQYQSFTDASHSFSANITGLTSGTTYYFRAEGINPDGPAWGSIANKPTDSYTLPQVQTLPYTNLGSTSVTAGYWYQSDTAATITILYANNSQFIGAYSATENMPAGSNGDSITLTGLAPSTTYWYKARVTNSGGTKTATTAISFTTLASGGTGGTATGGNTSCTITNFSASPTVITSGNSATVSWSTSSGCTSATVSGGNISSSALSGSQSTGALSTTTTYYITASGNGTSDSAHVTVTVNNGGGNTNCVITQFSASPSVINAGQSVNLFWSYSNCSYVVISGPGMSGTYYPGTYSITTSPVYVSGTYTITGYDSNGIAATGSASVIVSGNGTGTGGTTGGTTGYYNVCNISNVYASPASVQAGQSTTIYWNTSNCNNINLSGPNVNLQNYSANGSYVITPTSSGSYFLTATGYNGSAQSQVYVQVTNYVVTTYACNDGIDNDGDGKIDSADPGCSSSTDNSEYNYIGGTGTGTGGTTGNLTGGTTGGTAVLGFTSTVTPNTGYGNNLAGLAFWGSSLMPNSLLGFLFLVLIIFLIALVVRKIVRGEEHSAVPHH